MLAAATILYVPYHRDAPPGPSGGSVLGLIYAGIGSAMIAFVLLLGLRKRFRSARLGPALKWEPSRGGALFPHLYGPLPVDAVLSAHDLPLGADGLHVFPPLASA